MTKIARQDANPWANVYKNQHPYLTNRVKRVQKLTPRKSGGMQRLT